MRKQFIPILLFVFDLLFLILFYLFLSFIRDQHQLFGLSLFYPYPKEQAFVFLLIIILMLVYEKIYVQRYDFWEETKVILRALFLSFVIILSILMLIHTPATASRGFLIAYFLSLALFFPVFKRLIKKYLFKIKKLKTNVKIVGNKLQIKELQKEFTKNWYLGYRIVKRKPEVIFVASRDLQIKDIDRYISRYSKIVREIYILPFVENINFSQSKIIEYFNIRKSVIKVENNLLKLTNIMIKEIFDKLAVIFILPFFVLLHLCISYLIKKEKKISKILFVQKRIGKDNAAFSCYKYTTMLENADDLLQTYLEQNPQEKVYYEKYHKYINDPRITPVGNFLRKSSLDELPQIINVLKGEMSLIGPRPYMLSEKEKMGQDGTMISRVKPGISGLWQVSGRSELSFEARKKLDTWYIQNWSLWMDIVILIKTIKVVLVKKGAR